MITPFETFQNFFALKNHYYAKNFDYFKYNGKVKLSVDHFNGRKDKYQFMKLARLYSESEMQDFLVSNYVEDFPSDSLWIGKLFSNEARENYINWMKVKESLSYSLENDLDKLFSNVKNPNELFVGELPLIAKMYMQKEISIQTACILNSIANYTGINKSEDIIWKNFSTLVEKTQPFVLFNLVQIKQLVKNKVQEKIAK